MRKCLVNNKEVDIKANWSVTDSINTRGVLSCTLLLPSKNPTWNNTKMTWNNANIVWKSVEIKEGKSIMLLEKDNIIFSGIIFSIQKVEVAPSVIEWNVQAVDNNALAYKRLVVGVAENEYAGDIIKNKILPILAEEGVLEGNIEEGVLIKKAVFNYVQCDKALDQLKNITGYNWNIDENRKLNFFSKQTYISPFVLDNTIPHNNFRQEYSLSDYRNLQLVKGGKGKTAKQAEIPKPLPNGETKNFAVRFPLAEKPEIYINNVKVPPGDIGILGLDTNKKWYFSYNSAIIQQDNDEIPLQQEDNIIIEYSGLRNLLAKVTNLSKISERKSIEAFSGIYENIEEEVNISSYLQAIQFAEGLISKYGNIDNIINFTTTKNGLKAGQLLKINKPLFGIENEDFLIEKVNISAWDAQTVQYSVKALSGQALGSWQEYFKNIIKSNKKLTISENEAIITLHPFTESVKFKSEITVTTNNIIYPADNLYPANNLYPAPVKKSEKIYE